MAGVETLVTFNDVKFIDEETLMNQANWQEYFGSSLPNGIYSGFDWWIASDQGNLQQTIGIRPGTAYANGLFAKFDPENGYQYIELSAMQGSDNFRKFYLRIYLHEEKAEIKCVTGSSSGSGVTPQSILGNLVSDPYNLLTQTDNYYDIPLFGQVLGTGGSAKGIDLRDIPEFRKKHTIRFINARRNNNPTNIVIQGDGTYLFQYCPGLWPSGTQNDPYLNTETGVRSVRVCFDRNNPPKNAKLIVQLDRKIDATTGEPEPSYSFEVRFDKSVYCKDIDSYVTNEVYEQGSELHALYIIENGSSYNKYSDNSALAIDNLIAYENSQYYPSQRDTSTFPLSANSTVIYTINTLYYRSDDSQYDRDNKSRMVIVVEKTPNTKFVIDDSAEETQG